MVVDDRDDFLTLLVFIAGVADAIAHLAPAAALPLAADVR